MDQPKPNELMPDKADKPGLMAAAKGSIVVELPVADVYKRWLAFKDYPKFITAIKQMRKLDANHFVVSFAIDGTQYETTVEVMLYVPERRFAWRTLADQDHPGRFAAGVVSFAPLSDRSTCVTLKVTSSFGGPVSNRVDEYLDGFKRLTEQGDRKSTMSD